MAKEVELFLDEIHFVLSIKPIKNLYIRVKKDGKAYVSVPKKLTKAELQSALIKHLDWVKIQQQKIAQLPTITEKNYQSGEMHSLWGNAYPLHIESQHKISKAILKEEQIILQTCGELTNEQRLKLMDNLYREVLNDIIPILMPKWEAIIQVKASEWRLKKMKTRWGTCNTSVKRIWLNTELAKYPQECLEYVLVHELVHLLERSHNQRFKALMTQFLPDWKERQQLLNHLARQL